MAIIKMTNEVAADAVYFDAIVGIFDEYEIVAKDFLVTTIRVRGEGVTNEDTVLDIELKQEPTGKLTATVYK